MLFVRTGAERRFKGFSDSFSTLVLFYEPEGGNKRESGNRTED